jgi:3-oxoacyl-[acyl-carrier protein] reductase
LQKFLQTRSKRVALHSSSVESALALENELNALGIKAKGYQSNAADFNEAQTMVDAVFI